MHLREDDGVPVGGSEAPITPCQYGGDPDCTQCGCMASVGLEALGEHKLGGVIPLKSIMHASFGVGRVVGRFNGASQSAVPALANRGNG